MNREQLAHVLRAAAQITDDGDILVIGSQAILGSFGEGDLPPEVTISTEADLVFRDDPDEWKSDQVDGAIGEGSMFHETYSYYAQGVSVTTAVLPVGWEDRLIAYDRLDALPSKAQCIEAHDLVVSKLVAGREKDIDFAQALIRDGLVNVDVLIERTNLLPRPGAVRKRVLHSIERCARRAQTN
jgi:hypothetical protein